VLGGHRRHHAGDDHEPKPGSDHPLRSKTVAEPARQRSEGEHPDEVTAHDETDGSEAVASVAHVHRGDRHDQGHRDLGGQHRNQRRPYAGRTPRAREASAVIDLGGDRIRGIGE
jgi:hypothetical protein